MPREYQPYEQDFLLVSDTEMRVRQATQYAQLNSAMLPCPDENLWESDTGCPPSELPGEQYFDEERASVWESILERL